VNVPSSLEGWHLDKKVPVSIILVLVVYGISGLIFISDIKRDVEILKVQQVAQDKRDEKQDRDFTESVKRIEAKLDRLIEGQASTPFRLPPNGR
jgi:hypothetical protein